MLHSLFKRILRHLFHLLYHELYWTYDVAATIVSLGRWNSWIEASIPYVKGPHVLELGHGSGHLQIILRKRVQLVAGLDESPQMGRVARRSFERSHSGIPLLIRGLVEALPFQQSFFQSIVATFPTEYIFEAETLSEARRVLCKDGSLIIVPSAWITGGKLIKRVIAGLYRVTHHTSFPSYAMRSTRLQASLRQAGFIVNSNEATIRSSAVLVIVATKY